MCAARETFHSHGTPSWPAKRALTVRRAALRLCVKKFKLPLESIVSNHKSLELQQKQTTWVVSRLPRTYKCHYHKSQSKSYVKSVQRPPVPPLYPESFKSFIEDFPSATKQQHTLPRSGQYIKFHQTHQTETNCVD